MRETETGDLYPSLAHSHSAAIPLPLIETTADGLQQIGRQNSADLKLAFSLSDKNINFQLGLKSLIRGESVPL